METHLRSESGGSASLSALLVYAWACMVTPWRYEHIQEGEKEEEEEDPCHPEFLRPAHIQSIPGLQLGIDLLGVMRTNRGIGQKSNEPN